MQMRFRSITLDGFCRITFWPLFVLALVCVALELGAWKKTESHRGPFAGDPFATPQVASRAHSFALGEKYTCCIEVRGDNNLERSDLRLWINGREMGPPVSPHGAIRNGEGTGFSHWHPFVMFSLPPGVSNSPETIATVRYSRRPKTGTADIFAVAALVLGWVGYRRRLVQLGAAIPARIRILIARAPDMALRILGMGAVAAATIYLVSNIAAFLSGWALPTTALIHWSDSAAWAARNEPFLGHALIILAILGIAIGWISSFINTGDRPDLSHAGATVPPRRAIAWLLFVVLAALLTLDVSAMWSGMARPNDLHWASIGGLLQFTDAGGYLAGAHDQAKDGVWNEFSARRPMAAAFRSVLLFASGYSTAIMLALQAMLLAGAMTFATISVARWRGRWSALVFLALTYIYIRGFTPTTLTEALGVFWALISVPFFINAMRLQSLGHALIGFALTILALMTRMGSMLTIPALMLWMTWAFAHTLRERLKVLALTTAVIIGVVGFNSALQRLYGPPQAITGGNFSYSLCGMTIGKTWSDCQEDLVARGIVLPETESALVRLMYATAWENFKAQPSVFFRRLQLGSTEFVDQVPNLLWRGYMLEAKEPPWLPSGALLLLCLLGTAYVLVRRRERGEVSFWLLLLASIVASAGFVYLDDGRRIMAASIPWLCLFVAIGATLPLSGNLRSTSPPTLIRSGVSLLAITALLFLAVPALAHRLAPVRRIAEAGKPQISGEALVLGGRHLSGFLIVADDAALRHDIPSLRISELAKILAASRVEDIYQGVIHPEQPPLPFGLVFAPRLEADAHNDSRFIVPPAVLERRDVSAWRLKVKEWQPKPGQLGYHFLYATDATPLSGEGAPAGWK